MTTATMLYAYKPLEKRLYIHWPNFTESVPVKTGFDGEYVVFDDEAGVMEFMEYLTEHNIDVSEVEPVVFGGTWEDNALAIKDLI